MSNNGAFSAYRDNKTLMSTFIEDISHWFKENKNKIDLIHEQLIDGLDYFENIIITDKTTVEELLEVLSHAKDFFSRGCSAVFAVHWLPILQGQLSQKGKNIFDKKTIEKLVKWRECEGNVFFNKGIDTFYYLLKEIAERKKWKTDLLKYTTFQELSESILGKKPLPVKELIKRQNSVFAYIDGKVVYDPEISANLSAIGYKIKKVDSFDKIKELKGTPASAGKIQGIVRVIFNRNQLNKIKNNEILVAPMTCLWYMPAMEKASAFVTDEGGATCHAAIIAREMNKPCIVGTKTATQVLNDGDLIEIDAANGLVKILDKKL